MTIKTQTPNCYLKTYEVYIPYHHNRHRSTRMNIYLNQKILIGVEFTSLVSIPTPLRLEFIGYNYLKDTRVLL